MSSPSDDELRDALVQLKAAPPTLGIPKIHARFRRLSCVDGERKARTQGSRDARASKRLGTTASVLAARRGLDIAQWTPRVDVRLLVATHKIKTGETIWVEDPFVIAPEW
ncbi:hypothetical protein B0H14DRAFT_3446910 [Mycena olivaceomarginata]|nr:hypothetical protein B0H14DRAFT_3446910 [Mycena olivaceomarginata]